MENVDNVMSRERGSVIHQEIDGETERWTLPLA